MRRTLATLLLVTLLAGAAPARGEGLSLGIQNIDAEDYPDVRLSVTVPAQLAGDRDPVFAVAENGQKVDVLAAEHPAQAEVPVDVVLAIDTSGSMKGASLQAAKDAAIEFIDAMAAPNRVAIVAFSTSARVVARFTDDDAVLRSAINGLEARGETAAYDSLVAAAALSGEAGTNVRGVVFLSDGGDTMSRATLDEAVRRIRAAAIPVYAVSLPSYEADPGVLRSIASQTSGRQVAIDDVDTLPALYRDIAEEIQTSYVVVYRSRRPGTKDLEISVQAIAGDRTATASSVVANPRFGSEPTGAEKVLSVAPADMVSYGVAILLIWVSAMLLVLGVALFLIRPRTTIEQLRFYEQLRDTPAEYSTVDDATGDGLRQRMVDAVGFVAGRGGFTLALREKLERAGLPLRPAEYITGHFVLVVVAGVVTQLSTANLALAALVVLVATAGPILYIDVKVRSRTAAFEEQLPQILNLIAGSLRAGWGLLQSVDMVVKETLPPASDEFRRVQTEARLGLPVEDALRAMAQRVGSEDFAWAVTAISIQREVGGNLAEVLDVVAATIRERSALRRQVSALTAEGKLSAMILIALPFIEGIVLFAVNPSYMRPLVTDPLGWMILATGLLLLLVGSVWLVRALKVEV
ncbi:MAG: VWA domain-containing protein [Coriobacteriia bacterium]